MSLRVDTSPLISGALVVGNRGLGVLGSSVPSTGDNGAGYLYNDLSLPADANKEVRGLILTQPSAGTLYAYEDSSFEFTGAPDGTYTFTYRLYVDGADTGVGTVNLQVGSPVAAVSATTSLPSFSGSASVDGTPATVTVSATTALPVFSGSASGLTGTIARPGSDTSNSGWTPSTGSDLYAMLDEVSPNDADYISAASAGSVCRLGLGAVADPGTSSGQVVSYRASSSTGNGLKVELMQGGTVIATWNHATLPATDTTYQQSLSAAECDAITDYTALSVRLTSL